MMGKKSTHVVPNSERGGWDIKHNDAQRSSGHFDRKQETEFVIHNQDGKISQKDSHGNNPYPPKG